MRWSLLLTFAGMGVATYLTRAPLLVLLARRPLAPWLARYFTALPIALMTALALPLLVLADGQLTSPGDPRIPAAVLVALLARRTGNVLLSVAAGVLVVAGLRALVS